MTKRETALIAQARLGAAETGVGYAEDQGASRVEIETLNALHAIAWAVLALADVVDTSGMRRS